MLKKINNKLAKKFITFNLIITLISRHFINELKLAPKIYEASFQTLLILSVLFLTLIVREHKKGSKDTIKNSIFIAFIFFITYLVNSKTQIPL